MDLRRLPNLSALRAFEAAARLESFSRAAEELFVTHGAISHQIRALEQELGTTLFARNGKRISITPTGRQYALSIRAALGDIAQATRKLQAGTRSERRLVLTTMPSFASRWLTPRIGRFIDRHPELEVELRCSAELVDFERDDVDVALRMGKGNWPGLHIEKVLEDVFFPACSPTYNNGRLPRTAEEFRRSTLLRSEGEPWAPWFAAAGFDLPEPSQGMMYQDSGMLSQAAIVGQGVALVRRSLAVGDIMAGRLVRLSDVDTPCEWDYYFVCPPGVLETQRLQAFRTWFLEELAAFESVKHMQRRPTRPSPAALAAGMAATAGEMATDAQLGLDPVAPIDDDGAPTHA
ncbi:transcriptional regulator GcvA [Pandoraea nosoerga]|uniref:XRE family transcriptional regulator n=1 Tax=Pandoraea nosoerga TaxID=2508296 RepID=A0A5E4RTF8_9BURK|nr:transcriptional regulator GcvA [Pandoraea nosoerga]MBN4664638.1 transcriptional regulator GcvA [Pandoraea nosoerga]MBN4674327.1 transcriptional regulator GcvA [Pandoraea nosoerga]MBN4679596.1 transcriptional regulator GcvA [Pandoraea nosoerga]MBN4743315.1 transcriptional regulator GcvA [Pandoraea nosoerga]VVD66537.1 XRE family transcriptional regulator [Pandoraea nosoerga]